MTERTHPTSARRARVAFIVASGALWATSCGDPASSAAPASNLGRAAAWPKLEAGSGFAGAPEDESCRRDAPPLERAALSHGVHISPHEVRQSEFEAVMGFNPSFRKDCPDCPVDSVTFDEAALYCARLGEAEGRPSCYACEPAGGQDQVRCSLAVEPAACASPRLPTALEFEFAARNGARTGTPLGPIRSCMGRDPVADDIAWYKSNSAGLSHEVGGKAATAKGIYDLAGNVAEWTHDSDAPDSAHDAGAAFATLRGGSWFHNAHHLLAYAKLRVPRERRLAYAGFRCVQTAGVQPGASQDPLPFVRAKRGRTPVPATRKEPVKVAAVLSTERVSAAIVDDCGDDESCRVEALVREAGREGARLVVTPEYGLAQYEVEPVPEKGSMPARNSIRWPLIGRFAALADELDIYLVINAQTSDSDGARYNTVVALDPEGRVVGRHHKFELFAGEREDLTAGEAVGAFETPFGRVGLLVCADIYGQPALHHELMRELDARIIAWSASWTVEGATRWQAAFARDWNVYFVASNGAHGAGAGGGIYDPDGKQISEDDRGPIVYGELPM